jgi:hypothetical protein
MRRRRRSRRERRIHHAITKLASASFTLRARKGSPLHATNTQRLRAILRLATRGAVDRGVIQCGALSQPTHRNREDVIAEPAWNNRYLERDGNAIAL